jgi:hypothetical protein
MGLTNLVLEKFLLKKLYLDQILRYFLQVNTFVMVAVEKTEFMH